jgi:heptosyltransferase-3/putative inorganic carbon (HCO3(-)) transporter
MGLGLFAVSKVGYQRNVVHPETLNARLVFWKLAVGEVFAHPLVGAGYGNDTFKKRFAGHPEMKIPGGAHNTFLMVAMGSGLPALGFLVWTLARAVRLCLFRIRTPGYDERTFFLVGVAVMIVGFSVRNLFDYMFAGSLARLFWIVVAVAVFEGINGQALPSQDHGAEGLRTLS